MLSRLRRSLGLFAGRQQGSVAVEFAIIVPVLALLVFGSVDLGHAWYMKHVMQNGCREGTRYATRYQTNSTGARLLPGSLNPSIQNYILHTGDPNSGTGSGLNLNGLLPADANAQVTPSGVGFTESNVKNLPLKDLTVTITARKNWFVINNLVPGMTDYVDITVATTMKCE